MNTYTYNSDLCDGAAKKFKVAMNLWGFYTAVLSNETSTAMRTLNRYISGTSDKVNVARTKTKWTMKCFKNLMNELIES